MGLKLQQHVYQAFVDPSGGSADSFTLAIAHKEGDRIVVDAVHERKPPFNPETVVDDFAIALKPYRVFMVTGDRYGGEWPREQFRKRGINYVCAQNVRSDLYRNLLPLLNSGRVVLPKSDLLVNQIVGLERRVARSGKDSIDHAPGGHDDLANSVAGVCDLITLAERYPQQQASTATYGAYGGDTTYTSTYGWSGDDNKPSPTRRRIEAEMAAQVPMCTIDFNNLPKIE